MAQHRAPERAECLYWRGAVLGDLGRQREALRAIEAAFRTVTTDDQCMHEELYYEKALILEALGLHDAAVATGEAGLRTCPGSARLRAALVPAVRARVRSSLKVLRGGQGWLGESASRRSDPYRRSRRLGQLKPIDKNVEQLFDSS